VCAWKSILQISRTSFALKILEEEINQKNDPSPKIQFTFYRGRGDTIPRSHIIAYSLMIDTNSTYHMKISLLHQTFFLHTFSCIFFRGYGGSITKAICAQLITQK
jgi:hypothetical protein